MLEFKVQLITRLLCEVYKKLHFLLVFFKNYTNCLGLKNSVWPGISEMRIKNSKEEKD